MSDAALSKKLLIKPGYRVLILNAPADYRAVLEPLPEGVTIAEAPDGVYDLVQGFVTWQKDLATLAPVVLEALKPGGVLWLTYPKLSAKVPSDLTRDRGWDVVTSAGYEGVSMIAVNDTWSAMRFKPTAK